MIPEPIKILRLLLAGDLPGQNAQNIMAHQNRSATSATPPDNVRMAAVLILLYFKSNGWHIALIERIKKKGDIHSGQISFPGGKQKLQESLFETAVRESYEEINSSRDAVVQLGALTQLHIPVSNYLVHPFVGYLPHDIKFKPQISEVQSILEVPLSTLADPGIRQLISVNISDHIVLNDVPCYNVLEHRIWGATAMIISEFLAVLGGDPSAAQMI